MPRRKRNRKKPAFKIPLATVIGFVAGWVGPMGDSPIEYIQKGDYRSAIVRLGKSYTGYDANTGKWHPELMASGLVPLVVGCLVSKFVGGSPINLNKRLKIPFIKL